MFDVYSICWLLISSTKKEGYSEEEVQDDLAVLNGKRVRTVGNLRALTNGDIKDLGLPPVVTRYLLRVKARGEQ